MWLVLDAQKNFFLPVQSRFKRVCGINCPRASSPMWIIQQNRGEATQSCRQDKIVENQSQDQVLHVQQRRRQLTPKVKWNTYLNHMMILLAIIDDGFIYWLFWVEFNLKKKNKNIIVRSHLLLGWKGNWMKEFDVNTYCKTLLLRGRRPMYSNHCWTD